MTEYIDKEEVLKEIERFSTEEGSNTVCTLLYCNAVSMPTTEIPEAPHFETEAEGIAYLVGAFSMALGIVHCRGCKHNTGGECRKIPMGFDIACYDQWVEAEDDFFCKYGEENEDELVSENSKNNLNV